ncbi:MAG TPA: hypothetical protein VGJ05_07270 [Fimbriiglobus sp.]
MVVPIILAACFVGVFCLAPLAVYLLWLAGVHRRGRPVPLSGTGDFTALLVGLAGFLLAGGVVLLTVVQSGFRSWTRGNFLQLRANWDKEHTVWILTLVGYLLIVIVAAVWSYRRRRKSLVVYNVTLPAVDDAVEAALAGVGRAASRFGHRWSDATGDVVAVRPFHAMQQVTVTVLAGEPRLAEELDRQLRATLAVAVPAGGQIGAWIASAAWSCGLAAICCFGLLIFYIYLAAG